jgi:hypothetical protein
MPDQRPKLISNNPEFDGLEILKRQFEVKCLVV